MSPESNFPTKIAHQQDWRNPMNKLALVTAVCILSGCGGGGAGSAPAITPPTPPVVPITLLLESKYRQAYTKAQFVVAHGTPPSTRRTPEMIIPKGAGYGGTPTPTQIAASFALVQAAGAYIITFQSYSADPSPQNAFSMQVAYASFMGALVTYEIAYSFPEAQ